jgi:hypothetical protein
MASTSSSVMELEHQDLQWRIKSSTHHIYTHTHTHTHNIQVNFLKQINPTDEETVEGQSYSFNLLIMKFGNFCLFKRLQWQCIWRRDILYF